MMTQGPRVKQKMLAFRLERIATSDAHNPTKDQEMRIMFRKDRRGLRGEMKWIWDKSRINAVLSELDEPSRAAPMP
jgi:hypothetical protein